MSCKIILDTPGILSPGCTMYGRVVCTLISNLNIREIRCKLKGTEQTRIKRGKNTYIGENEFLNLKLRLLGESNLQSGVYEYPFYFPLPLDLPSSFNGEFGSISYLIKAAVDIPFSFDYKDKFTFVVTVLTDFNKIRRNLRLTPIAYQSEKNLCCWCCASEPITINLCLNKNAFILGELAKVTVEVTNLSNKNVEELVLTLIRQTYYQCERDGIMYNKTRELLGFQTATGVGAHGERTYTINFQIPHSILIYNLASCYLINQFFTLRAEAVLPLCHKSLTVETDIKLGHIPLRDDQNVEVTTLEPIGELKNKLYLRTNSKSSTVNFKGHTNMPQLPRTIPTPLLEPRHISSSSHVLNYDRYRETGLESPSRCSQSTESRRSLPATIYPPCHNLIPSPQLKNIPNSIRYLSPEYSSQSTNEDFGMYPRYPSSIPTLFSEYPPSSSHERLYPPESIYSLQHEHCPGYPLYPHDNDIQLIGNRTLPSNYRSRVAAAPGPLAADENYPSHNERHLAEAPPPSYEEVMRDITRHRSSSMIIRR